MTHSAPSTPGVTTPPTLIPNCPECGDLLGLYYAECVTCAHHASDYSFAEYAAARGGVA
jgi:hypothetical protein